MTCEVEKCYAVWLAAVAGIGSALSSTGNAIMLPGSTTHAATIAKNSRSATIVSAIVNLLN
jgi:hypothetical protein